MPRDLFGEVVHREVRIGARRWHGLPRESGDAEGKMRDDERMSQRQAAADLLRLIDGFKISQAIHTAAVLGVADRISDGVCVSDDIADATGAHREAMYRLLRALAAHGVLREDEGRRFSLTPMGECLRSEADLPLAPHAVLMGQPYYWQAWGHLLHSVKTGENAFRAVHGMANWAYRAEHPGQSAIFDAAMTANSRRVDRAIVDACDFSRYARIADIGGGQGSLLAAILAACPGVHGVLFDQPHVIAAASPVLASAGVADRCELVGGSFLEGVPGGCAAYIMKFIVHDWNDVDATRILQACRRAMPPGATLFVIERLIGPPNEEPAAKLSDLNMLVVPGGRERTREEFAALFEAAELRLVDVVPTSAGVLVLTGEPA